MPDPAQPGTLRTLARRAILCLLLGAVLQYLVAAAFSLGGSYGKRRHSWVLEVSEGDSFAVLCVYEHPAIGRDVLTGAFFRFGTRSIAPVPGPMPEWSKVEWLDEFDIASRLIDPSEKMPPDEPPAWSRFAAIRTDPKFDYLPVPLRPTEFMEVATGWPMRSASYFAHDSTAGKPLVVREGIVVQGTSFTIGTPTGKTPRVIPLRIYWPGAIINTLLYAASLFVPFTLIPLTRRHLRRRAGRCIACGYDLRGAPHDVCPECGSVA